MRCRSTQHEVRSARRRQRRRRSVTPRVLGANRRSCCAGAAGRADAAIGCLAGNVVVAEAQKAVREKHRRIRQDVQARIQASREHAERPTTVPPWRSGHTVKLIEGDWKGRTGQVLETHLSENEPTMLTVQLFPAGLPVGPLEADPAGRPRGPGRTGGTVMAPAQGKENVAVFNPIVLRCQTGTPTGPTATSTGTSYRS